MKKILFISAVLAAMSLATVSCDKEQSSMSEEGSINVTIINPMTKADPTAGTDSFDFETQLNSVTLFVYEKGADGVPQDLYKKVDLVSPFTSATINGLKKGDYIVYGVANLTASKLSTNQTLASIKGVAIDMDDNSVDKTKGLVLAGQSSVITVNGENTPAEIVLQRNLGRISLKSVVNNLASKREITPLYVMLINGSAADNLGMSANESSMVNMHGETSPDHIITTLADATGSTDNTRKLTFQEYNNTQIAFGNTNNTLMKTYCYRTSMKKDDVDNQVKLVLAAKIAGDDTVYYYPVTISSSEDYCVKANTTYEVNLTIIGKGSIHPNKNVEKGSMNATVTVKPWAGGAIYNPTI